VRYNDNWTRETLETVLRSRVQKAAEEIGARYELTFSGTGTVFLTQPGPLVETMAQAVQSVTGKSPKLTTGGGTSDARFIQAVCPVIEFGLVNETIHQVDEHVAVNDLIQLTEIYERFIRGYFASAA
jgi:succinyl-diaminopimelate desuccinylase